MMLVGKEKQDAPRAFFSANANLIGEMDWLNSHAKETVNL